MSREVPLVLSAVKSSIGHTEAAAGIAGLVQLVGSLTQGTRTAIMHLRDVNPHVSSMLSGVRSAECPRVGVSRELGSLGSAGTAGHCFGGASAFAFQGTNAHAMACSAPLACASGASSRHGVTLWQHDRCWYSVRLDLNSPRSWCSSNVSS